MCVCDYDPPQWCRSETRRARKPHKCGECAGEIQIGERYHVKISMWDSSQNNTFKWCSNCLAARKHFIAHDECGCWMNGGLWEIIEEEWQERGELWLGRMLVAYRNKWVPAMTAVLEVMKT